MRLGLGSWIAIGSVGIVILSVAKKALANPSIPAVRNQGVLFAKIVGRVWPVISSDPNRFFVPYHALDGTLHPTTTGNRHFGAMRQDNARQHAAMDLVSWPGDPILAIDTGTFLGWIPGFGIGAGLDAAVIEHRGVIVVYAEIAGDKTIRPGAFISAGQQIGTGGKNSSGNSMLHFETWTPGAAPVAFTQWWTGKSPPQGLLDPTQLLLALKGRAS